MPSPNRRNWKFGQRLADDILELVAKGVVQPTKIAIAIGVNYKTLSGWLLKSSRGDPDFLIQFHGEQVQFAKAFALSKRLAYLELRGLVEQTSIFGREEVVHYNGQVVFAVDLAAAAIDDPDIREMLGYRRDALLEIDKKLVPVCRHVEPPFAMQLRVLEAAFKDMRPSSVSEVSVSGNVAHGIQHLPPVDYSRGPPAIPPPPVPPELVVIEPEPSVEAFPPTPETMAPQSIVSDGTTEVIEPEPDVTPEPLPAIERSGRPLSPLEADLLRRYRSPPEERSKPI